jgi:hypothetical protein
MAKKAIRESKSAAIRAYKENNPAAGPTAIAEALSKEGMKVTPAFVSTVLSNARRKSRRGKRKAGRKPGRPASTGGLFSNLLHAKKLSDIMGGIPQAQEALNALSKLFGFK